MSRYLPHHYLTKIHTFFLMALVLIAILPNIAHPHEDDAYLHDSSISHANKQWMSSIPNYRRLSELSIPGTHDTFSRYGGDAYQTQTLSLNDQLNAGIRVLDIRARHINNVFAIHHEAQFQNAFFIPDVLQPVTDFLRNNPSETVIIRLKEEYKPEGTSRRFAETFLENIGKPNSFDNRPFSDYIFRPNGNNNPTMSQMRGKMVFMLPPSLFNDSELNSWGLPYNRQGVMSIQDNYSFGSVWGLVEKWGDVKNHLNTAQNGDINIIYINYLSASGGATPSFFASGHSSPGTSAPRLATGRTTPGWTSPEDFPRVDCLDDLCTIAYEGTNILTKNYIHAGKVSFSGIIMADFPGIGLIEHIIGLNTGVTLFADPNFTGNRQAIGIGRFNLNELSIGNDKLSSLKVPPAFKVTLYKDPDFQGSTKIITADTPLLTDFNDITSSLEVTLNPAGTAYELPNYQGRTQTLYAGTAYNLADLAIGNDNIRSIKVAPGFIVTLYEHESFGGRSKVLTEGDTPFLSDFNALTSSIFALHPLGSWPANSSQHGHGSGNANGSGWDIPAQGSYSNLTYGPYAAGLPAGHLNATFMLMIDNNTADNLPLIDLDVCQNCHEPAGKILMTTTVTRQQFLAANKMQNFTLPFDYDGTGLLEFRVFVHGQSYVFNAGTYVW